jgi:hypothetical protein
MNVQNFQVCKIPNKCRQIKFRSVVYKKVSFHVCSGIGEHVEGVSWRTQESAERWCTSNLHIM